MKSFLKQTVCPLTEAIYLNSVNCEVIKNFLDLMTLLARYLGSVRNLEALHVRHPCRFPYSRFLYIQMITGSLLLSLFTVFCSLSLVTSEPTSDLAFLPQLQHSCCFLSKDTFLGFTDLLLFCLGSFKSHSGSYSSHFFLWFSHWFHM